MPPCLLPEARKAPWGGQVLEEEVTWPEEAPSSLETLAGSGNCHELGLVG